MSVANLSTVQTGAARKAVCDVYEAGGQLSLQITYSKEIEAWCNCDWSSLANPPMTTSLGLSINTIIDSAVLDGWETDLTARGYTVTRDGDLFQIDQPSS